MRFCAGRMPANGAPVARRPCAGSARRVADRKSAIVSSAHGRAVETTRSMDAHFQHKDVLKACRRGVLLFGYFLLDKQEKVTRPRSGWNVLLLFKRATSLGFPPSRE